MKTSPELQKAVTEYQKGSIEAFNIIYEQSYKYLHTCVIHVVKNEDMAMDMLQETYLEISKSISQLKSTEDFLSWAAIIANRKCFAHLKKQKDILLDGSGLGEGDSDSADSVTDYFENIADNEEFIPETVLQDREKQRLIKEIIDGLNDMQRLCVIGFYYNEQKQEEIAEELGIPVNTVKSHLNRAKAKIKEAVVELDVKKGTRLYSFAPFMALLFREEVQACALRPMSKGLASAVGISAGVGSGALPGGLEAVKEFITENFGETLGEIFADTIGKAAIKVKALWARFTAASIQTEAVVVTTACAVTIGGAAVVLSPEEKVVEVPVVETVEEIESIEVEEPVQVDSKYVISERTKELFDTFIDICERKAYEEINDLLLTGFVFGKISDSDTKVIDNYFWETNFLYNEQDETIVGTLFYDGEHTELVKDFTGYGVGIQGTAFTFGNFINGKLVGRAVTMKFQISDIEHTNSIAKALMQITEYTVENGEIIGETVVKMLAFDRIEREYRGTASINSIDFDSLCYQGEPGEWREYYTLTGEVEYMEYNNEDRAVTLHINKDGTLDTSKCEVYTDAGGIEYYVFGDKYFSVNGFLCGRGHYELALPIGYNYLK